MLSIGCNDVTDVVHCGSFARVLMTHLQIVVIAFERICRDVASVVFEFVGDPHELETGIAVQKVVGIDFGDRVSDASLPEFGRKYVCVVKISPVGISQHDTQFFTHILLLVFEKLQSIIHALVCDLVVSRVCRLNIDAAGFVFVDVGDVVIQAVTPRVSRTKQNLHLFTTASEVILDQEESVIGSV